MIQLIIIITITLFQYWIAVNSSGKLLSEVYCPPNAVPYHLKLRSYGWLWSIIPIFGLIFSFVYMEYNLGNTINSWKSFTFKFFYKSWT